jgi:hypothetical protein
MRGIVLARALRRVEGETHPLALPCEKDDLRRACCHSHARGLPTKEWRALCFPLALSPNRGHPMDRVTPSPTIPTTPGRPDEANVFRVECAGLSGWVVYLVGHPARYRFLSQDLAVRYACMFRPGQRGRV